MQFYQCGVHLAIAGREGHGAHMLLRCRLMIVLLNHLPSSSWDSLTFFQFLVIEEGCL